MGVSLHLAKPCLQRDISNSLPDMHCVSSRWCACCNGAFWMSWSDFKNQEATCTSATATSSHSWHSALRRYDSVPWPLPSLKPGELRADSPKKDRSFYVDSESGGCGEARLKDLARQGLGDARVVPVCMSTSLTLLVRQAAGMMTILSLSCNSIAGNIP